MNISNTGFWDCASLEEHSFDASLAKAISTVLKNEGVSTVMDIGCGGGQYVDYLRGNDFAARGVDGNPNTEKFCKWCICRDVSVPTALGYNDCVISLEVGEHIPQQFEDNFLDNVCKSSYDLAILSWAVPGQGGHGHINEWDNSHVAMQMLVRGFVPVPHHQSFLREAAELKWFKNTIMVFRRNK